MPKKLKLKKNRKKASGATAIYARAENGSSSIVGIGNLRVVIIQEEQMWYAQGLEIDYATQANSLPAVKALFADGLEATVHENLRVFGTIEKMLKPAPPEVWREMIYGRYARKRSFYHSQLLFHEENVETLKELPFGGIDFLEFSEPVAA